MEYKELIYALKKTDTALERFVTVMTTPNIELVLCKDCVRKIKKRVKELRDQKRKLLDAINEKQCKLF